MWFQDDSSSPFSPSPVCSWEWLSLIEHYLVDTALTTNLGLLPVVVIPVVIVGSHLEAGNLEQRAVIACTELVIN